MQTQQSDVRRGVQYFMAKDQKNTTEKVRKHIGSPQESESSFTGSAYNKVTIFNFWDCSQKPLNLLITLIIIK